VRGTPGFPSFPVLILSCLLLPLLVGFDIPDSSGTYAKVGAGRGAYRLIGCDRRIDSEFREVQVDMRHTLANLAKDADVRRGAVWTPDFVTLAYFAGFQARTLTLVQIDSGASGNLGEEKQTRGFGGGAYLGFDWRWLGLQVGWVGYQYHPLSEDGEGGFAWPMAGVRLGKTDRFYATCEIMGSQPILSGGGMVNFGAGMKLGSTRLWAGQGAMVGTGSSMGILKAEQGIGALELSMAAMAGLADPAPTGLGIARDYGISLGLSYRLSSLR
jgi:hypothetical protein